MASNALDNALTLSAARSDPTAPTNLQRALDYSLDGNTDASTTDFQPDEYADVDWKRLRPDIIGALMAVGSWDKEGIIDIVDGQLKRPQKEGTGHTR